MDLPIQIRQQQSTVQMLEKLLKAKRCSQDEVDQAKRRLVDLQEQVNFKPLASRPADPPEGSFSRYITPEPVATGRLIEGDEYNSIQADLSKETDRLNRKMADLSNKLHQVPVGVSCPELTKPILEIKAQIETIWDRKRYIERNHVLPEEPSVDEPDRPERVLEDAGRFQLAYEKRRLIDLRSKLRRKLENPKAKPGKVHEWQTELQQANLQIAEIDAKLGAS